MSYVPAVCNTPISLAQKLILGRIQKDTSKMTNSAYTNVKIHIYVCTCVLTETWRKTIETRKCNCCSFHFLWRALKGCQAHTG